MMIVYAGDMLHDFFVLRFWHRAVHVHLMLIFVEILLKQRLMRRSTKAMCGLHHRLRSMWHSPRQTEIWVFSASCSRRWRTHAQIATFPIYLVPQSFAFDRRWIRMTR
nr:hypothetical protein CFP56_01460 [Quercus suber]